jgi:phosphoesterase RecJ-like protein
VDISLAQKVIAQIGEAKHPAILAHLRPDGDAFGSILGLAHTLRERGAQPQVFVEGGIISMYQFLPGSELVQDLPASLPENTDCFIALDTSTRERLGQKTISWTRPVDIVIDHHISNPGYGKHNLIIADIPSTTGVLFELFQIAKWKITPAAATCLFTGLTTDTGSFRYRGTSAQTLHTAAKLVELGADPSEIAKQCYLSITHERHALKRLVSNTLTLKDDNKSAFLTILPEFYAKSGAKSEDTEGIIEEVASIQGVEVGSLFEFTSDGGLRVSLRSKGKIDVNGIASSFGGGGHKAAAGIRLPKDAEKNRQLVLDAISKAISNLQS